MFSVDCDIVAKATHTEVVEYRDLLLLQTCKIIEQLVEMISEAQRTVLNLAASSLSHTAQVSLLDMVALGWWKATQSTLQKIGEQFTNVRPK